MKDHPKEGYTPTVNPNLRRKQEEVGVKLPALWKRLRRYNFRISGALHPIRH